MNDAIEILQAMIDDVNDHFKTQDTELFVSRMVANAADAEIFIGKIKNNNG
jgi:hypothetical protein